jgi:excisionase family DNA binding protein
MHPLPNPGASTQLEFDFEPRRVARPTLCYEPLLTIAEACEAFNLQPHVLRRAIKSGAIPAYRLGNGRIRARASDIEVAIQASRRGDAT